MFILQNAPAEDLKLPGVRLRRLDTDVGVATFDLTLSVEERPTGLSCAAEYNTDLFEAATIQRMMRHLQTLLENITVNPDLPVSAIPLLTAAERQQLLVEWNDTTALIPQPDSLCAQRARRASRPPSL
jgi:non-ribosomal peptide synthetase component F